ncbi:hypothetical protein JHK85_006191 [Glycine max]|nr:hypothetical protein JHK85_006191 [Glycine max]
MHKNHTPSNTTQDHQFVSHDLSYSTDDDLNMTQENIAIGMYLPRSMLENLRIPDAQTFPSSGATIFPP